MSVSGLPDPGELRDFISDHFSHDELLTFCADYFRDFYLDYTGVALSNSALARELVGYCERRSELRLLRTNLRSARPEPYLERFGDQVAAPEPAHAVADIQPATLRPSVDATLTRRQLLQIAAAAAVGALGVGAIGWLSRTLPSLMPTPTEEPAAEETSTPEPAPAETSTPVP